MSKIVTANAQRRSFMNLGLKGMAAMPFGATIWLTPVAQAQAKGQASINTQVANLPENDRQVKPRRWAIRMTLRWSIPPSSKEKVSRFVQIVSCTAAAKAMSGDLVPFSPIASIPN